MQTQKEAMLCAYRHQVPEVFPDTLTGNLIVRAPIDRYYGPEQRGKDLWGVTWLKTDMENPWAGMSPDPEVPPLLEDIADWREIKFPDLDSIDWSGLAKEALNGVDREKVVVTGMISSGLFERMNQLMGMENALCAFYEDPDEVKGFFAALADFKLDCIDRVVKCLKPDIIQMHDDWGMSTNMFFSPELWREFIRPHEARFAERIHSYGLFYEHHSCGYIQPIVGDLVEIGVDALNPLNTCNNLRKIKQEYGKYITLVGGYDNQLVESEDLSGAALEAHVKEVLSYMAPGGSFVSYFLPMTDKKWREVSEIVKGLNPADFQ